MIDRVKKHTDYLYSSPGASIGFGERTSLLKQPISKTADPQMYDTSKNNIVKEQVRQRTI